MVEEVRPRAAMFENVRGLMDYKFAGWRQETLDRLEQLGYEDATWKMVYAADFGVAQLRPRSVLVAFRDAGDRERFEWPEPVTPEGARITVGDALKDLVASNGWHGAGRWATEVATAVAPTLVGGSEKHGGPDLGPTRARAQWLRLGVDGLGLANHGVAPGPDWPEDKPFKLNVRMAARIQGFPDTWKIDEVLRKTNAYKTMGNAFPHRSRAPWESRSATHLSRDGRARTTALPQRALPDCGAHPPRSTTASHLADRQLPCAPPAARGGTPPTPDRAQSRRGVPAPSSALDGGSHRG